MDKKEYLKIEKLKELMKQRTASKAIKKAVDGYLRALSKLQSLEEEFEKIYQSSYTGALEVRQLIRDLLMWRLLSISGDFYPQETLLVDILPETHRFHDNNKRITLFVERKNNSGFSRSDSVAAL